MQKQAKIAKNIAISAITLGLCIYIFVAIYINERVYFDNKAKSDAIIVLGAKSFVDDEVNQCVVARVEHAVNLYNDGYAKKIIMSGGTDRRPVLDTSEGNEMKKIALSLDPDINPDDILVEGESTSTYENLVFSQKILEQNNLESVIIITEPFHSPRADLVAQKLELNHTISPTLTSPCWNKNTYYSGYFLREPFVLIIYKLFGQI